MNKDQIKTLQSYVGVTPDGIWGPRSNAACQSHLRALMPAGGRWPGSGQRSLQQYYGRPGDESRLINMPVPHEVTVHYEMQPVKTIRCHHKVAASLFRILTALAETDPGILLTYAGCYNNRSIRGGSTPSLHAYGAAIDFAPGTNGNHTHWPTGGTMPIKVMECFSKEGWLSAGAFWNRDAMHFQATS